MDSLSIHECPGNRRIQTKTLALDESSFAHDLFISYSRKDLQFAQLLGRALTNYSPPNGLGVPARRLRVFRDQSDLTGVEYHQSIAREQSRSEIEQRDQKRAPRRRGVGRKNLIRRFRLLKSGAKLSIGLLFGEANSVSMGGGGGRMLS